MFKRTRLKTIHFSAAANIFKNQQKNNKLRKGRGRKILIGGYKSIALFIIFAAN